jgi:dGTPase
MINKCKCKKIFRAIDVGKKAKRNKKEKKHKFRTEFERDRDRILYSKAFRRLSGKTQVFVTGHEDHIRTRLTHTLEVYQIAKTIASYFGLDIALTEAIALGHDIGHTPFGHEGERILNFIMNGCEAINNINNNILDNEKGFKHNWQSLRVLTQLEKKSEDYNGLNLTNYTLWGIANHSELEWGKCKRFYLDENKKKVCSVNNNNSIEKCEGNLRTDFYKKNCNNFLRKSINNENNESWTFEGLIVRQADEIAQRHHDIEDGIIANLIDRKELIEKLKEFFSETKLYFKEGKKYENMIKKLDNNIKTDYYLPILSRLIVDFLVMNLINNTENNFEILMGKYNIRVNEDFYSKKLEIYNKEKDIFKIVDYNENFGKQEKKFKEYLKNRILNSFKAQSMDGKANYIIKRLFKAYLSNPQQLPDKTIVSFYRNYNKNYLNGAINKDKQRDLYLSPALVGGLREKLKKDYFKKSNDIIFICTLLRTICDYVSGMTDNYALNQHELLYGTKQREINK